MAELSDVSGVDNEEDTTVPSKESEESEASLIGIKHLLLGVQKPLHTMQSEKRKMSEDLKELRASFDNRGRQISQLKQSLAKANKGATRATTEAKQENPRSGISNLRTFIPERRNRTIYSEKLYRNPWNPRGTVYIYK